MKNKQKKNWCEWCGDYSTHTSETHVYENEVADKKRVKTKKKTS